MQTYSNDSINIIRPFEGCHLIPYICPALLPTIGYGKVLEFVKYPDKKVPAHLADIVITNEQADMFLKQHLTRQITRLAPLIDVELEQHEFDALLSLTYNIGVGRFRSSSMRMALNAGDFDVIPKHFASFRRGGGKILKGLVRRRCAEIRLWNGESVSFGDDEDLHYEAL